MIEDPAAQAGLPGPGRHPGTEVLSVREEPGLAAHCRPVRPGAVADVGSARPRSWSSNSSWTVAGATGEDPRRRCGYRLHIEHGEPAGELTGALTWDDPEVRGRSMSSVLDATRQARYRTRCFASQRASSPFPGRRPHSRPMYRGDSTTVMARYSESRLHHDQRRPEVRPVLLQPLDLDAGEYIPRSSRTTPRMARPVRRCPTPGPSSWIESRAFQSRADGVAGSARPGGR